MEILFPINQQNKGTDNDPEHTFLRYSVIARFQPF